MINDECTKTINSKLVSIPVESGKRVVFNNLQKAIHEVVRYDGCCVHNVTAADYVVSVKDVGVLVVELKGSDIVHAGRQIIATAQTLIDEGHVNTPVNGLIVATRVRPQALTGMQIVKDRFARMAKGKIHLSSGRSVRGAFSEFL